MKKAFTMIELIFIIVIIGILAAVAIPKLAANRDDAEISNMLMELAVCIENVGAYNTSTANPTTAGFESIESCSNLNSEPHDAFDIVYNQADQTLTVAAGNGDDAVAVGARTKGANMIKTYTFRGERVE